ncbi:MAG: peptidase S8 family protein, partial [Halothiobacillaceae bacterium]
MKPLFQPRALRIAILGALILTPAIQAAGSVTPNKIVRVEPILKEMAATQAELPVLLVLTAQPQHALAKRIRAQYEPKLELLARQIRDLYAPYRPKTVMATEEEELAFDKLRDAQLPTDIKGRVDEINKQREALARQMRQEIAKTTEQAIAVSQSDALAVVQGIGGRVMERIGVVNAIAAVIPSGALDKLASYQGVTEIAYNQPGKPELDNQASSLGVNAFWSDGYDGGIWDVGVLDEGVDETHPALAGHTFYENYAPNGAHGTGVACMYGSSNATHKGLAFGLNAIIVDNAGDTGTSMSG